MVLPLHTAYSETFTFCTMLLYCIVLFGCNMLFFSPLIINSFFTLIYKNNYLIYINKIRGNAHTRVLLAFHRETGAPITMKTFFICIIHAWKCFRLLETIISVLVTEWWPFKNLLLCGNGRVILDFHGKPGSTATMKLFFYQFYTCVKRL